MHLPFRKPQIAVSVRRAAALAVSLALAAPSTVGLRAATPAGAPTAPADAHAGAGALAVVTATRLSADAVYLADATVEAARRVMLAAQVPGRLTRFEVRAGDTVARGQVLARIDERAAVQQASASSAQVAAADAAVTAARKELERNERLFGKQYISQAAMDRARAQYDAAIAQARASAAQAGAAGTLTSLHTVVAPFSGRVARTMVEQGDLAMPDKPLLELFDPSALRVSAMVPETVAAALRAGATVTVTLDDGDALRTLTVPNAIVMPVSDPASHAVEIRLPLSAADAKGLAPGRFARVSLPLTRPQGGSVAVSDRLTIPVSALVRRTEFAGVYVVGDDGRPRLRQVRPGRVTGDRVEILAGLTDGERIAADAAAAARVR